MKTVTTMLLGLGLGFALSLTLARAASDGGFKKEHFNYSEWAKGRFSEAVTVNHPGRFIYLAGVGAEDETGAAGKIRHTDDVFAQCKYAWDKIKRTLEKQNATLADIVKVTTYVTDMRSLTDVGRCRSEVLAGLQLPVHTLVGVSTLAWPGMMVEVDVTAVKAN